VLLGQDGQIWHEGGACKIDVQVTASWHSAVPADWLTLHRLPETYDYRIDHEVGRVFVKEELARRRQPLRYVLEVGGCCNPMTWDLPCEVVSTDIDVQTLQVGALHFAPTKPDIKFVAADALKQRLQIVCSTVPCCSPPCTISWIRWVVCGRCGVSFAQAGFSLFFASQLDLIGPKR
jgi:hypothetical protein